MNSTLVLLAAICSTGHAYVAVDDLRDDQIDGFQAMDLNFIPTELEQSADPGFLALNAPNSSLSVEQFTPPQADDPMSPDYPNDPEFPDYPTRDPDDPEYPPRGDRPPPPPPMGDNPSQYPDFPDFPIDGDSPIDPDSPPPPPPRGDRSDYPKDGKTGPGMGGRGPPPNKTGRHPGEGEMRRPELPGEADHCRGGSGGKRGPRGHPPGDMNPSDSPNYPDSPNSGVEGDYEGECHRKPSRGPGQGGRGREGHGRGPRPTGEPGDGLSTTLNPDSSIEPEDSTEDPDLLNVIPDGTTTPPEMVATTLIPDDALLVNTDNGPTQTTIEPVIPTFIP